MVGGNLMEDTPTTRTREERMVASLLVSRLDGFVTNGPRDLEIALAMSDLGYDAVKWAEGQGMLAELVSFDAPASNTVSAATAWYEEAVAAARQVLTGQPRLLAKLGLGAI